MRTSPESPVEHPGLLFYLLLLYVPTALIGTSGGMRSTASRVYKDPLQRLWLSETLPDLVLQFFREEETCTEKAG